MAMKVGTETSIQSIGLSFPANFDAPSQAQRAEDLGFSFIGFFDSPALEPDIWITIANAVQQTRRIQIGTEVLVPHLRHPMTQATAIATIEQLAPGRLYVGIGTGFTGRMAMGQRPLRWAFVSRFVKDIKSLLAGEDVVVDGAITRMMHPPGFAPQRPIRVPILVAANGPKGIEVVRELGDGLIYGGLATSAPKGFSVLQMGLGTILLDEGESPTSDRAIEAARQSFAMQYHLAYEGFFNPPIPVEQLPYGADWLHSIEAIAPGKRHLHLHDRHMVGLSAHDAAFIKRHPEALAEFAARIAVTAPQLRERFAQLRALGATRITCGVSFANWKDDMERYAKALDLAT
jgi:5,10-methylenetetrahydromethanopterin reductase